MARVIGIFVFLSVTAAHAWLPESARAGCVFWDCCDDWGYNFQHGSKDGCRDDGGNVVCDGGCPGQGGPFWKCCDANQSDLDGVFPTRHSCKTSGGFVEEDVLRCANDDLFRCCDPVEGGHAPLSAVSNTRAECISAGYEPRDWSLGVCPGGILANVFAPFHDLMVRPICAFEIKKAYKDAPLVDQGNKTQMEVWDAAFGPHPNEFTDKDEHCIMSCLITVQCGKATAALMGWARETAQMCDSDDANAWGSGDECANEYGRDFGDDLSTGAVIVTDIVGNPFPNLTPAVLDCHDYCAGLDLYMAPPVAGDEGTLCLPTHTDDDLQVSEEQSVGAAVKEHGAALLIPGVLAAAIIDKCDDAYLGGLTFPTALADAIAGLKSAGATLTAAAANQLEEGETGTFASGAMMHRLGADEYALRIHLPPEEVDAFITYLGGEVSSMRFRGANGQMLTMTSGAPVEAGCPGAQCENRVPWMQWARSREPIPAILTGSE